MQGKGNDKENPSLEFHWYLMLSLFSAVPILAAVSNRSVNEKYVRKTQRRKEIKIVWNLSCLVCYEWTIYSYLVWTFRWLTFPFWCHFRDVGSCANKYVTVKNPARPTVYILRFKICIMKNGGDCSESVGVVLIIVFMENFLQTFLVATLISKD